MSEKKGSSSLRLVVLTPTRRLIDAQADEVYFPSTLGRLGILPGHADLITQVGTGVMFYNAQGTTTFFSVSGGVADVNGSMVTLLVDSAEEGANIDVTRAKKALEKAQMKLGGRAVEADLESAAHDEARALARIEASALHSGSAQRP